MRLFPHDPRWKRLSLPGTAERLAPDLAVRRFTVPLAGSLRRPFRLAFFSDLHWDGEPERRLQSLVERVNAAEVDAVLFGGDLAAHLVQVPEALRRLSRLRARHVCAAVRGNRESACGWLSREFWRRGYGAAGFLYLENEAWLPADPWCGPAIVGVDDQRHGRPDLGVVAAAQLAGWTVVALTHNPDVVAGPPGGPLGHVVLSGHTHGGQFRLPGFGPLVTSSRYWRQFDQGWRRHDEGALLYVTSGVGETGHWLLRRRVLCPPEVVLLDLVPSSATGPGQEESI